MMFRLAASHTPGRDGGDIGLEALLLGAVGLGRQLHERVQRDLGPGRLVGAGIHKVRVDAADDGLVRHDDHVAAPLEFHDDRFQPDDDVTVRLAAAVSVVVFVVVASLEVFGVAILDLLVGEAVADARVDLVEGFPFQLVPAGFFLEESCGLDGAL